MLGEEFYLLLLSTYILYGWGQKCLSLNYAFWEKGVSQLAYMGKRPDQQHKNLID